MAPIKLYGLLESAPCRLAMCVLKMINIEHELCHINPLAGEHKTEEYKKISPAQKVPAMVDGDLHLGESRAIVCYLANKYLPADNTLYPVDPAKRAQVDELLYFDIGTLYVNISRMIYPLLFGSVKTISEESDKATRLTMSQLEERLSSNGGKKFLLGDHVTLADLSIVASISVSESIEYDLSEFKLLTEYLKRVKSTIPDIEELFDEPIERMRQIIKSKQQGN